ncbi:hypothetical protein N7516_001576 [Penicillium verrucosum]|uniref:uncharacterized protein n=1 Tax=Penicillium verrucosum TaxID=60171 RepID=UPI002544F304|nr:uncharacterized protein N7516_001576 [Penicillium verrucosum]KAJ5941408.1 hypothetical protein N7516_001576 [Penicillium verrucosum]
MSTPQFWSTPFRYIRWAAHEKPAILAALAIGFMGPVSLASIPPSAAPSVTSTPSPFLSHIPFRRVRGLFLRATMTNKRVPIHENVKLSEVRENFVYCPSLGGINSADGRR